MRLIDEKGRVLGTINIVDLLILFLITAAALFALKWSFIADDPSWMKVKTTRATCVGTLEIPGFGFPSNGLPNYVADIVKEGDAAYDANGVAVAFIEKVLKDEPGKGPVYYSKDGEKIFYDPDLRNITVRAGLLAYKKKGRTYPCITNVPLRVGDSIQMNTKNYFVHLNVKQILNEGD